MAKVWLLVLCIPYEDMDEVLGVYSTFSAAEAVKQVEAITRNVPENYMYISEWTVDGPTHIDG